MQEKQQEKQKQRKKRKNHQNCQQNKITIYKTEKYSQNSWKGKRFNHKLGKILQNTHQIVIVLVNICPFVVVFKS